MKELYPNDVDFSIIHGECHLGGHKNFYLHNDYHFKGKRLCVPQGSLREVQEG